MGTTAEACVCCGSRELDCETAIWMPFVSHRAMALPPLKIDRSLGLATIPDGTAYALCKSLLCKQCGHLFADYRFSDEEMGRLYGDYRGESYTALRDSYEPGYAERNQVIGEGVSHLPLIEDFLLEYVPDSDIAVLDWGGDTGINTPFGDRRSLLHIFDPSAREAADPGAVSFAKIPEQKTHYDLIVLSHVLEHIPLPDDTLRAILPFMNPKTVLYVEVPLEKIQQNAGGPPYSGADRKRHWHEHINFFTPQSMETLLRNSGLRIIAGNVLDISTTQDKALGSAVNVLQYACGLTT